MTFEDFVGNKRIKKILTRYLKNKITPFSIIFYGPKSANPFGFAFAYAKALNCQDSKTGFCGNCQNCQETSNEIFPDLIIMEPDGQFYKKEQISFIVNDNPKKPMKGEKKIYILKNAHCMNEFSANAFLKVLEEPAPSSIFLLVTDNLNRLLPTIKSRCQIIKFSPPARAEIKEFLIERGEDEDQAQLKSYLSQTNLISLLKDESERNGVDRFSVIEILSSLIQNKGMEDILLDLYKKSYNRVKFLNYFASLVNLLSFILRDIMVLSIDPLNDNIINIDCREKLTELSNYITTEKVLFLIRKMEFLLRDIQRNLNTKVLIIEFMRSYASNEVVNV